MRILCACEESQACCIAFRERGHEAYSCDLEPCSGGHPEWHIQDDVLWLLDGRCSFKTMDGAVHSCVEGRPWDMILAFPPCTHLCVSGARWFAEKRADGRQQAAIDFFLAFTRCDCQKVAIENPVGVMSKYYRKPDQIIQPYEYGHPYTKKTCLWLKGLPKLRPTNILERPADGWRNQNFTDGKYTGYGGTWGGTTKDGRWRKFGDPEVKKERSKTFHGIAKAMAEQWGVVAAITAFPAPSMKQKSIFETANPTEAQIREQIEREFERWNEIAYNGCFDPSWEDGANMRLIRNHILYWYDRLADGGFTVRTLFGEFPEEKPVPPEVPYGYMVRGGKNAGRVERWAQYIRDGITWGYPGEYAL